MIRNISKTRRLVKPPERKAIKRQVIKKPKYAFDYNVVRKYKGSSILPYREEMVTFFSDYLKDKSKNKMNVIVINPQLNSRIGIKGYEITPEEAAANNSKIVGVTEIEITPETDKVLEKLKIKDKDSIWKYFMHTIPEKVNVAYSNGYKAFEKKRDSTESMALEMLGKKPKYIPYPIDFFYYEYFTKGLKLKIQFVMNGNYNIRFSKMIFEKQW